MSHFFNKLASGEIPSNDDWNNHLIKVHDITPSITPRVFAPYKAADGLNSYEFLANQINPVGEDLTGLDLACGDGFLIPLLLKKLGQNAKVFGIDMSSGELAVAKKNIKDPRVSFFCSQAQNLPLDSQSIDIIVSHMAFMLMNPVEEVIAEITRVLKPRGRFSAIIANTMGRQGLFGDIRNLYFSFFADRYPKIREVTLGDHRVHSNEGLKTLFPLKLGYSEIIDVTELELEVSTDPQGVWDLMKDMYLVEMLPPSEKEELRVEMLNFVSSKTDTKGQINFWFPIKGFTVTKL